MQLKSMLMAAWLYFATPMAGAAEPAGSATDLRLKRLLERATTQSTSETLPAEARQQMLTAGEAALARGDTDEAALQFERAGMVRHEADAELGLIRAYMQAGEYRRALAFAAHTAGAHPQSSAGSALYAWLLHIGGQAHIATQLLDKARARLPEDGLLRSTTAWIQSPLTAPAAELLVPPARFAPYSFESSQLPPTAVVIASGVLIDGGRKALTAAGPLGNANEVWVRNGRGQIARAKIVRLPDDAGLAELQLVRAIAIESPTLPPRDPFPGSPGFAAEFPVIASAAPGWPLLRVGFLGKPSGLPGVYHLGITLPRSNRGGPVFDAGGRLAGIAISGENAGDRLVLASHLRKHMAPAPQDSVQPAATDRVAVDEIYERALTVTVQVLAAP